jgi:hypothetical protein
MSAPLEQQLLGLLSDSLSADATPRKQAEIQLLQLQAHPDFPASLLIIAEHTQVDVNVRQASLIKLRLFIEKNWGGIGGDDETVLEAPIAPETKEILRTRLVDLVTREQEDRKISRAAR